MGRWTWRAEQTRGGVHGASAAPLSQSRHSAVRGQSAQTRACLLSLRAAATAAFLALLSSRLAAALRCMLAAAAAIGSGGRAGNEQRAATTARGAQRGTNDEDGPVAREHAARK